MQPGGDQDWPEEALKIYDKVRLLGRGAFGAVWLCKSKAADEPDQVAVKFVSTRTAMEASYAEREISVLKEVDHPNICKLVRSFEPVNKSRCVVMTLAVGPTVELLLKKGGALGLPLARVVTTGLIEAVAYLHSRAVLHRDLKPDNCLVVGAHSSQELLWSDDLDAEKFVKDKKLRLVLVDFGFARALGSAELEDDIGYSKDKKGIKANEFASNAISVNDAVEMNSSLGGSRKRSLNSSLSKSFSRKQMTMSAVGNRNYAAPEIVGGARKKAFDLSSSEMGPSSSRKAMGRGKALSDNVADYGMVADAFSLGCILRYIFTGVPPDQRVDEYIGMHNSPLIKLCRMISQCVSKKEPETPKRYRHNNELPEEVAVLIKGLIMQDKYKRTTVRAALEYPWVQERVKAKDTIISRHDVQFLDCVVKTKKDILRPAAIVTCEE